MITEIRGQQHYEHNRNEILYNPSETTLHHAHICGLRWKMIYPKRLIMIASSIVVNE
jgi:hypothetical protein